ncbi:MAG: hypothetical protein LBT20_02255 [Clostridiales bacterium]|jgi:hypothetical protein|nr:hypothetical protein [Clostridiales bacterium]
MKNFFKFKYIFSITTVLLVLVFALSACIPKPTTPTTPPDPGDPDPVPTKVTATDPYDYYDATFGVGKNSVFQTLVYNDLITLLSDNTSDVTRPATSSYLPNGDYVILFGGAWDADTKAVIKTINDEAKAKGIKKIYFFDPILDGNLSEDIIKDLVGTDGKIGENAVNAANIGKIGYTLGGKDFVYDDFNIKDYKTSSTSLLTRINRAFTSEEKLTVDNNTSVVTPLLISVHRESKATDGVIKDQDKVTLLTSRVESPLIGNESGTLSASDLNTYKANVDNLLDGVVGKEAIYDPFLTISSPTVHSGKNNTHLTANNYFQTISYVELIALLQADGERFIFFGGTWCPNTAAIYAGIQEGAAEAGYTGPIYLYDPILTASDGYPNTRAAETAATGTGVGTHSLLYANLLEHYFTTFTSRWNNTNSKEIGSRKAFGLTNDNSNLTISINGKNYTRMCVPNLILYNNAVEGGIVESFEAELTWNTGGSGKVGGTGNVNSSGVEQEPTFAYLYFQTVVRDIFAKVGLRDAFAQLGYTLESDITNIDHTVITITKGDVEYTIVTYYLDTRYEDAISALGALEEPITVTRLNSLSFAYGASAEVLQILAAIKDGTIYTTGIILG